MVNIKKTVLIVVICTYLLNFASIAKAQSDELRIVTNGTVTVSEEVDEKLYIGGSFTEVTINDKEPIERHNLVEIDTISGNVTSWNPDPDFPVQDIISYENTLLIVGQFTKINTEDQPYFAKFDLNSKEILTSDLTFPNAVYALDIHEDTLYIGGEFSTINEEQRSRLATFNLNTNSLTTWGPAVNDSVYEIATDTDIIYIGGAFTNVNGEERNHVASFNYETGELTDWKPSVDIIVTKIEILESTVVVHGYVKTDENVEGKKITVDKEKGEIILEEPLVITENIYPVLPSVPPSPSTLELEPSESTVAGLMVDTNKLGFQIPSLSDILTFAIRGFFVISGLAALFFLLMGAFGWVTSGGDEESITAARNRIQAAIMGLLMMVAVLSIVWTLEQIIFNRRLCFGISCPVTIPTLLQPN